MYDSRSEPREFVGEDRVEAIDKACRFFGMASDELEILEFPSGEVYGLAGRTVVVAAPRGGASRSASRAGSRADGRVSESRGREDRPRRGGRDRGRRREEGEGRPPRPRRAEPVAEAPPKPSIGTSRGSLGAVGSFLLGLIERMDLGRFEIAEKQEGDLLVCEVSGEAARELSSGDGRAVGALQLLANQVSMRASDASPRVVVEVEGDAEAREEFLSDLAHRVARRARGTERPVALDPMNARDRRMIHVALRDVEDVATMSVGEGQYRQVVVVPEGAPEFEKARREAREAAARSADS